MNAQALTVCTDSIALSSDCAEQYLYIAAVVIIAFLILLDSIGDKK